MRPIPKQLLIHQVMLHKETGSNIKFSNIYFLLRSVRMEPSSQVIRDRNNAEIRLAATLFYDCVNSRPRDISFQEDEVIIFNGQRHQVKIIEPLYDGRRLHHYELGLVKYGKN